MSVPPPPSRPRRAVDQAEYDHNVQKLPGARALDPTLAADIVARDERQTSKTQRALGQGNRKFMKSKVGVIVAVAAVTLLAGFAGSESGNDAADICMVDGTA